MPADYVRPPEIQQFLETLLEDAGLHPEPELKEMMLSDLESRLQTRLTQVIAEHMEEDDLETFGNLSAEDPLKGQEFLNSKISNLPQLYLQAMEEFRQAFLNA